METARITQAARMTLDDVVARMGWDGHPSVSVTPLGGGITNLNYRVDVDGEAFVVRMPGRDSENLGIERPREVACNRAAYEAGVAPEVVAFFEESGVTVTRFISGRVVQAEKMHVTSMLARVAAALRRYHGGRPFPGVFSPFQAVREYLAFSEPRGAPLPERFGWMRGQADRLEGAIGTPATLRPCHNDLLLANWIEEGDRLWIIDWEYAAMGDIYFDLGNFAVHMQLTDDEEQDLIRAYFGEVDPRAAARLKLMKVISDLREAMWAMVQVTISTLDYDFVAYGTKHFNRCTAQLRDARLGAWLRDAPGAPDLPGN